MDIDIRKPSSSESEDGGNMLQLQNAATVFLNDFIFWEFQGKNNTLLCYYVGQVVETEDSDGDIAVQFYRKQAKSFRFVGSTEDVSLIHISKVKSIFPAPESKGTTSRTQILYRVGPPECRVPPECKIF